MEWQRVVVWSRRWAMVGAGIQVLLWLPLDGQLSLLERVLLLGVLVIVPLGISLVPDPLQREARADGPVGLLVRGILWLHPVGAAMAIASVFVQGWGWVQALLAAGWLGITGCCGLLGLFRWRSRNWRWDEELGIDAALGYVVVGGFWFVCARAGYQFLGFDLLIVFLTAVHFHFAGFSAPFLTGLVGRMLPAEAEWGRRLFRIPLFGVVVLPGLIAIAFSRFLLLEFVAVVGFAVSLWVLGVLILGWIVPRIEGTGVRILLSISGLSLVVSMGFACAYAYGKCFGSEIISISRMAQTHGVINALGFALCGLLGFAWWTGVYWRSLRGESAETSR